MTVPSKAASTLVTPQHVDQEARELIGLGGQHIGLGAPVRIVREQLRIMRLDHAGAGAGRRDHVVVAVEGVDHLHRQIARGAAVAGIVGRLAAAGLDGHLDDAAGILQELHGRKADGGAHQVDEAGDEQADPGLSPGRP